MKNNTKKELTCRMAGVRDVSTGRFYTAEEIQKDPELKKQIEKKMNLSINKAFGYA